MWGKKEDKGGNVADADVYLNQIRDIVKQYRRQVDQLTSMRAKTRNQKREEICLERVGYKDSFIAKKKAARANIQTLKNGLDVIKESELKDLQEEFRGIDMEFKAMGLMADKDQLFDGPKSRSGGGSEFDPKTAKNSEVLSRAKNKEVENLDKLKEANIMVHATKEQGVHIAAQLKQDVEKIDRISAGLDDVTGELALSKIYITRVLKRMATDKVILAFAFLLIFAIIGIIVYSIVGKGQTARRLLSDTRSLRRS